MQRVRPRFATTPRAKAPAAAAVDDFSWSADADDARSCVGDGIGIFAVEPSWLYWPLEPPCGGNWDVVSTLNSTNVAPFCLGQLVTKGLQKGQKSSLAPTAFF